MNDIYMTESGIEKIRDELNRKMAEYEEIRAERAIAHDLSGDGWHDNPHFNRMQQLEAEKSRDIAELKRVIESARIITIDPMSRPTEKVCIGSVVKLLVTDVRSGKERDATWEIVGYNETDVRLHKLAYNAPIASAILGQEVGAEVEMELPAGPVLIEIVSIESKGLFR